MALPAGRKGVLASEITPEGKIKGTSELPEYSVSDAGKFLGVDAEGKLAFSTISDELPEYSVSDAGEYLGVDAEGKLAFTLIAQGVHLYKKTFGVRGSGTSVFINSTSGDSQWNRYESVDIDIEGYTPVFAELKDVNSGYSPSCFGFGYYMSGTTKHTIVSGLLRKTSASSNDVKFDVYYLKNTELTITELS